MLTQWNGYVEFRTHTIDRLDQIEKTLKLLPTQITASTLSSLPSGQLVTHRHELKAIQEKLAATDRSTPNFWPTSFQVLTLLSQATSNPTILKENVFDDVNGPPGSIKIENTSVLLKHSVSGAIFRNSIVRFDPTVKLANDVFINCVFIFPTSMVSPPKSLQEIADALLSSDISNATITAS